MDYQDIEKQVQLIVQTIDQNKGENINVLPVTELTSITDFFIIATGRNPMHTQALMQYVEEAMKKTYSQRPLHVEGAREGSWILLDYGDIIVQLFVADEREHYGLDKLWGDAPEYPVDHWLIVAKEDA